jgi:hypothetical protein
MRGLEAHKNGAFSGVTFLFERSILTFWVQFNANFQVADGKTKITSVESIAQRQRTELNGSKPLENMPIQLIHPTNDDESGDFLVIFKDLIPFLDSDEPLLSGSGTVNQECDEDVLKAYEDIIAKWKQNLDRCVLF